MARVKRGSAARNKHKKVFKVMKGSVGSLHRLYRPAHQSYLHTLQFMYRDRRNRKRDFRSLWIARINGALEGQALSYSRFICLCGKKQVKLNRKVLSELAIRRPEVFEKVVAWVQN
ncbi:MAG: 50S ribosomal protein L20 [Candidatus Margulisiibacteriota bacterium]